MSVTAITARFATLVWTAATIRFITQTPRMMKNKGNALTIGFVRACLVFAENKLRRRCSDVNADAEQIRHEKTSKKH